MDRNSRDLEIVLFAFALLLSSSLTQLHAKQVSIDGPSIRVDKLMSYARWHMLEIANIERSEGFDFAPGD